MCISRAFAAAGYFVQRSGWKANDAQLIFDCGGLGISSGGHGHADALSLTLFSGGREFLIDPGTSAYNGAPHPNVQAARRQLMELYQAWGKPELVERYRVPPGKFYQY